MSCSSSLYSVEAGGVQSLPPDDFRGASRVGEWSLRIILMWRGVALATMLLLGLVPLSVASTVSTEGLTRWGSGEYRRFGFLVYAATLWAGDDPTQPPVVLRLDYQRHITGRAIVEASVQEMRRFVADENALQQWGEALRRVLPDVRPGDHLVGVYRADGASFFQDERLLGEITLPGFAPAFFAIWLDARTSAPALRAALLRRE